MDRDEKIELYHSYVVELRDLNKRELELKMILASLILSIEEEKLDK